MPLARDLSHLPSPAKTRDDGCPPDSTPRFAHLLAEHWATEDRMHDTTFHLHEHPERQP
jgi:hypothetical protein